MYNNYNRKESSNQYNRTSIQTVLQEIDTLCLPWTEIPAPDFSNTSINDILNREFSLSNFRGLNFL